MHGLFKSINDNIELLQDIILGWQLFEHRVVVLEPCFLLLL